MQWPKQCCWLTEASLEGRDPEQPAEGDNMQCLSHLGQKTTKYRQHPSVQSAPESATYTVGGNSYLSSGLAEERHTGREALFYSSSAPAHMMSHLAPVRTSIPLPVQKQVSKDCMLAPFTAPGFTVQTKLWLYLRRYSRLPRLSTDTLLSQSL